MMRKYARHLYLILALVFLLGLGACGGTWLENNSPPAPTLTPSEASATPVQQPRGIIPTASATVVPSQGDETGITQEQDSLIPPIPPADVRASQCDGVVEVQWQGTGSDIIIHYVVYRRVSTAEHWVTIGQVVVQDDNQGQHIFYDSVQEKGVIYEYAVAAVDRYGNESSLSETANVEATP
jgi:hypothetical protein